MASDVIALMSPAAQRAAVVAVVAALLHRCTSWPADAVAAVAEGGQNGQPAAVRPDTDAVAAAGVLLAVLPA